jgi:serine/threonine-protein phosphatase 2A regulatory subunit B
VKVINCQPTHSYISSNDAHYIFNGCLISEVDINYSIAFPFNLIREKQLIMDSKVSKWVYVNGFGERDASNVCDQDILSTICFDYKGNYLCVGDRAGRIIIFQHLPSKSKKALNDYAYFSELQSHENDFDVLTSKEIEEKITAIEWLNRVSNIPYFLVANEKTIKLWKIFSKEDSEFYNFNKVANATQLKIPKKKRGPRQVMTKCVKSYFSAHKHHINSLSYSFDNEHFLSADELSINIWNVEVKDKTYNFLEFPSENLEELTEVITSAQFHPKSPNMLAFSTSRGLIKLCDLRTSTDYKHCSTEFKYRVEASQQNFFTDIINTVSQAAFTKDGDYIVSRDYLSVKVWDIRNNKEPCRSIRIGKFLEKKLCDLYESENIYDKFNIVTSSDKKQYITGTYNNSFMIGDIDGSSVTTIESSFKTPKLQNVGTVAKPGANSVSLTDISHKISCIAWHPIDSTIAMASHNCFFIYNEIA